MRIEIARDEALLENRMLLNSTLRRLREALDRVALENGIQ